MPNTIIFVNKQKVAAAVKAAALHKQKIAAALKAAALHKQRAAALKAAALQKQRAAAAVKATALQKQRAAALKATALQKQYKKPNPTPIILSAASDYISVPGIVFNQNGASDLNRIHISVSSDYVPAI